MVIEQQWYSFLNFGLEIAGDNKTVFIGAITTLVTLIYFIFGFLHLILDITSKPSFLYKYKIQKKAQFDVNLLGKLLKNLISSWILVQIPFIFFISFIGVKYNRLEISSRIPHFIEVAYHLFIFTLIEEILFYYSHRVLHFDSLYRHIHKIHHEFTSPIALAATYAHPLEVLISNLIPLAVGPLVMQSHVLTMWLWFIIAIIGTQVHHCGYRFPWHFDHQPNFHDLHHEKFKVNYGLLGILDQVHGTYRKWNPKLN